jgi:hypothetical protein
MIKLPLNGRNILEGIKKNNNNFYLLNPDIQDSFEDCFDRNGKYSINDLVYFFKKNKINTNDFLLSPNSHIRYLGYLLLLVSEDTSENLWSAFEDSFFQIRRLIILNFNNSNRHKLFNEIFKHFTQDPRWEIRNTALLRIKEDFSDLFSYRMENLSAMEQRHIIYLLNSKNSHDRNILENYVNNKSQELSSMAVYCLQKRQPNNSILLFSQAEGLSLLRYHSLHGYCQKGNDYFLEAFSYLKSHFPLDLQDEYLHELTLLTPTIENKKYYLHAIHLIEERSDPLCSQRLEEFFDNKKIYHLFGSDLIQGFSNKNKYQTCPLLLKILKNEKNISLRKILLHRAALLQIPLPREISI